MNLASFRFSLVNEKADYYFRRRSDKAGNEEYGRDERCKSIGAEILILERKIGKVGFCIFGNPAREQGNTEKAYSVRESL